MLFIMRMIYIINGHIDSGNYTLNKINIKLFRVNMDRFLDTSIKCCLLFAIQINTQFCIFKQSE